jgi:hypothetical protein
MDSGRCSIQMKTACGWWRGNGNTFKSFPDLCEGLARDLKGRRCVLDGEIVCLDSLGKPQFEDTSKATMEGSGGQTRFSRCDWELLTVTPLY